jgi:predicted nuclease of predicted toxin-antitoxin system
MKLLADECVYQATVTLLRSWGYDTVTVQEARLAGKPDEEILAFAVAHERVLLTIDMDFSNIRHYPPKAHTGIIVLKIRPRSEDDVHAVLKHLLENTPEEKVSKSLVMVDQSKYRIR